MDFFSIILFLGLYYVRPHEWISFVAMLKPITLAIGLALLSLLVQHRGLRMRDLLKTPHDWMMAAYFLWILFGSATPIGFALHSTYSLFVFYWVTVLTLVNITRLEKFLNWWLFFILVVAALAVASEYGFDPMISYDLTHGAMKDRLVLNTSIFNNPNALGHSIVPAAIMLYFIGMWKRPIFVKVFTPFLMILPLACLWMTVSKGAFLSSFATVVTSMCFKRPKLVQALILWLALTSGWVAVQRMPRMQEIEKAGTDKAIQGRVAAFRFGLNALNTCPRGVGFGNFETAFEDVNHYPKAAHSSYVNIGAELGRPGLYLFLGILYCCLRTLIFANTVTVAEERARRVLFVLLFSYMVSSWMVGWHYRATFFLTAGAIAAFHRQMRQRNETAPAAAATVEIRPLPAPLPDRLPPATPAGTATVASELTVSPPAATPAAGGALGIRWNRISWVDLLLVAAMTKATVMFWNYAMMRM